MSLVEVLIAIALLGLIAVTLLFVAWFLTFPTIAARPWQMFGFVFVIDFIVAAFVRIVRVAVASGARVPLIGNVIQNQFLQARDWPFGERARFRLLLQGSLLEFYLDDEAGPCIIMIQGTINLGGSNVRIRDNKTIIGLGTNATLVGEQLRYVVTDADVESAPRSVVVNERFATHFFGAQDPVGRRIAWTGDVLRFIGVSGEWRTVVGVVGNTARA